MLDNKDILDVHLDNKFALKNMIKQYEELYKSLGGENEFNMQLLQLMPEDIDRLEEDTKNGKIKEYDAPGFFFGNQEFENYEYDAIMRFCQAARRELDKGNAVYYESWY